MDGIKSRSGLYRPTPHAIDQYTAYALVKRAAREGCPQRGARGQTRRVRPVLHRSRAKPAPTDTVRADRGPPLGKADLQAQHDMLADLYEKMKMLAQEGFSGHDMLQEKLTAPYDERWGDPEEFLLETYRGMWAHTYDMGGFI